LIFVEYAGGHKLFDAVNKPSSPTKKENGKATVTKERAPVAAFGYSSC